MSITERQRECLLACARYQLAHGVPPAIRDLCAALDVRSTNCVAGFLDVLRRHGLVVESPHTRRSLTLSERGWSYAAAHDRAIAGHVHDLRLAERLRALTAEQRAALLDLVETMEADNASAGRAA